MVKELWCELLLLSSSSSTRSCGWCVMCDSRVVKAPITVVFLYLLMSLGTVTALSVNGVEPYVGSGPNLVNGYHRLVKRSTGPEPEPLTCNSNQSQWACDCHGECSVAGLNAAEEAAPCCLTAIDSVLLNQSVVLTLSDVIVDDGSFASVLEPKIKGALVSVFRDYCGEFPTDCTDINDPVDAATTTPPMSVITAFSARHVVFSNVSEVDSSTNAVAIRFLVLIPDTSNVRPVTAILLQRALLNQSVALEDLLDIRVKSIKVLESPPAMDEAELPVGGIVAGVVLGFLLGLCCIISAVKAVRDRKMIKMRNAIRKEVRQKRRKELQDSIRRASPKRVKGPELAEPNGDAPAILEANGEAASASAVSPHVVQVVVHSHYDTAEPQSPPPPYDMCQAPPPDNHIDGHPPRHDDVIPNGRAITSGGDVTDNGLTHADSNGAVIMPSVQEHTVTPSDARSVASNTGSDTDSPRKDRSGVVNEAYARDV